VLDEIEKPLVLAVVMILLVFISDCESIYIVKPLIP